MTGCFSQPFLFTRGEMIKAFQLFPMLLLVLSGPAHLIAAPAEDTISGITHPSYDAAISAHLPGTVKSLEVEKGARVKAGQLLIRFEDRIEELEVLQRKLVFENDSQMKATQHRRDAIKKELNTSRELIRKTGSISKEALESKELELNLVNAEIERLLVMKKSNEILYQQASASLDLRKVTAAKFLKDVKDGDEQELMARITGNFKRGNERSVSRKAGARDRRR